MKFYLHPLPVSYLSLGNHLAGMPGSTIGKVPIVRIFGVTMDGNSVCAHVHGFSPYFFVPAQPNFKPIDCGKFRVSILVSLNEDLLLMHYCNKLIIYSFA